MPSFFIIAFIWRGLIFPGSIFLTTLPYFYGYSILKCKHFRPGNHRGPAGEKPVFTGDNQNVVARANAGVCSGHVLCKRVLALCDEGRHVILDNDPVRRGGEDGMKAPGTFDAERQPAIRCPDGSQPAPVIQDLPDTPGRRVKELAPFGEETGAGKPAELVISYDLNPPKRTVLRVTC
jgi:hypothetical protein